jgi:diguanylate cyclase (GGDEF)-like protein
MERTRYDRAVRHTTQKAYATVAIDILTGLYSHSFLHDHLTIQIADASHGGHSLSVCYFAIDGIDRVNQQCGYAAGDQLLHQVGRLIGQLTRTEDFPARYGGAEFCVTLFGTDLAGAGVMTHRLASIIGYTQLAIANLAEPVRVGIRVGISTLCPGDSAVALIARAAKDAGHPA